MTIPNFDDATAVTTTDSPESDEMAWSGHLTADWSIGKVPNGGYSAAVIVRALLGHTGAEVPLSLTTHYYRPAIADAPVTVRTEVRRRGRTMTHADAIVEQDGKVRARSVAVLGSYPATERLLVAAAPPISPIEQCVARNPTAQGFNMSLLDSLEILIDPSTIDTQTPDSSGARVDGWVRFRDDRPVDALALALFVDSFPPAALLAIPETGWVPTVEMTTHVRAQATNGWIRAEVTTDNIRGGTLIENVRLWDTTDTLVAEGRQLALLAVPQ